MKSLHIFLLYVRPGRDIGEEEEEEEVVGVVCTRVEGEQLMLLRCARQREHTSTHTVCRGLAGAATVG